MKNFDGNFEFCQPGFAGGGEDEKLGNIFFVLRPNCFFKKKHCLKFIITAIKKQVQISFAKWLF